MQIDEHQERIIREYKEFLNTEINPFAHAFEQNREIPCGSIGKMGEKEIYLLHPFLFSVIPNSIQYNMTYLQKK